MKPTLFLALLLAGCAHIAPHAGLCDLPTPAANFSAPSPVPSLITGRGGCWFLGVTAKV